MNRIFIFENQLSQGEILYWKIHYKTFNGRYFKNLQNKGSGWSFPNKFKEMIKKKDVIEKTEEKNENELVNDIPIEWKLPFKFYFDLIKDIEN